jgi:hypothetical protein
MWPFKKKSEPLNLDPERQDWMNMKGEIQGLPAFIRLDAGLKKVAPHADYGYEILVSISFNSAQDNGLPESEDDLCAVDDIEELFKTQLERGQNAVLALVITTGGVRELYFYCANPDLAVRRWEDFLQPRMETHQVHFVIRPDADWEVYHQFA